MGFWRNDNMGEIGSREKSDGPPTVVKVVIGDFIEGEYHYQKKDSFSLEESKKA